MYRLTYITQEKKKTFFLWKSIKDTPLIANHDISLGIYLNNKNILVVD